MQRRAITAAAVTATTVLATALTSSGSASATPSAKIVPNTKPAWTAHATHYGRASTSSAVKARVYLAPRGGLDALRSTAEAVSTPGSPSYGKFLTAAQYRSRFSPTVAAVNSVSSYLRSAGLHVSGAAAGNRYVTVTGTVQAAEKAFATTIGRYRHDKRTVQAPESDLKVPAKYAASVLTISGLDTTPKRVTPASKQQAPPPAGFHNGKPCSSYYGQIKATDQADFQTPLPKFKGKTLPYAVCGYTGPQLRAAYYNSSTKLDGSGITVAITDAYAAPTIASDANTYAVNHGDGAYAAGQFVQSSPARAFNRASQCGPSGWYGEETLDVEAVHAMAPGAKIHYYASASCFDDDFLDTLGQVVDDDDAQLVSNSWSDVESAESADAIKAYESVFLQGATEGISFMFSSGDDGDEVASTGIKQTGYPGSDPYVTAVGGTSTAIGSNGRFIFNTGWGTEKYSLSSDGKSWSPVGYLYGAGGGESKLFNQPSYQAGVAPGPNRSVPDVAMDADPTTGMLVGETQSFADGQKYDEYRIGGTSLASPLFAGMTALTLQNASAHAVGLLNPTIYRRAQKGAFTDVTGAQTDAGNVRVDYANGIDASDGLLYSVRTFNQNSSLPVTGGYDQTTGVGRPNVNWITGIR